MPAVNPEVDAYFGGITKWRGELEALRAILLESPLTEGLKWRCPCYTFQGRNIAIIGGLKECCTLSFFKGALLGDSRGILAKPGENTQAARVIRFTNAREIAKLAPVLKAYVAEAIELEKAGVKVELAKNTEHDIPEEVQAKFDGNPVLRTAFDALTPGRQRAYLLYFSAAKQSKTRASRVDQYTQQILDGKGMNDCTCGLSKKLPACDGSHKQLR